MSGEHDRTSLPEWSEPGDAEIEQAEALREALEGRGSSDLAELAKALRFAENPPDIDVQLNDQLVSRAIQRAAGRRRILYVSFGASAALAIAAAAALLVTRFDIGTGKDRQAELTCSRTTQPLFESPFPQRGGTSARVDRIADSRWKDYRANQFSRMGVR